MTFADWPDAARAAGGQTGFADQLAVTLTLTIAGTAHAIPGAAVKALELDLRSYGFSGSLTFLIADDESQVSAVADELFADFVKPDLIEIALTVAAVTASPEAGVIAPIELSGLVTERAVAELPLRGDEDPALMVRRYRIAFADPAQVLWTQHFPCQLYTDKSMVDVIDDQRGDKITVRYDFAALSEVQRQVFLHLPRSVGASFGDFLAWYLDGRAGVFSHDYATASYAVTAAKGEDGTIVRLFADDIADAELRYPPVPRHAPWVLNSYAHGPRTAPSEQAHAQAGIRSDILLRTPLAQVVDDEVGLQAKLVAIPCPEAHLAFARMPTGPLAPGTMIELAAGDGWSRKSALVAGTWRVRRLRMRAVAPSRPLDQDLPSENPRYQIELRAELERRDEPRIERPPFRAPSYPGLVEGKVVSEQGDEGEPSYQVYRDEETALDEYRVKVPLWDDQVVCAPCEPIVGAGNVYLPSYRDERVLLALDVHAATIARLLEWRAGAPLAMECQGEHILFGKTDASQTSVNHVYDGDQPVFNVARTHERDRSLIQLREGTLVLHVKEEEE